MRFAQSLIRTGRSIDLNDIAMDTIATSEKIDHHRRHFFGTKGRSD
jgi:hypothetical protein